LIHNIRAGDVEHGGLASAQIKRELCELGVSAADARRAGIIAFEAEINLMVYSTNGGTIAVTVSPEFLDLEIEDTGPGIEDIDLALTPGFSTAPPWATDLGFGAGMGLNNMQSNADWFEIHSHVGSGTRIVCRIARRGHDAARDC
jgi:anti-sigma regulatory factor (Ser/Thr protein kinase)